MKKRKKQFSYK